MKQKLAVAVPILAALGLLLYWLQPSGYCDSAYDAYGFKVPVCPTGHPRQIISVEVADFKRAGDGKVSVSVKAHYTTDKSDEVLAINIPTFKTELFLVDSNGQESPLSIKTKWNTSQSIHTAIVRLPKVHDGDYLLRVKVKSKIASEHVDLKLALYSPARIHMLTDRPLYEPGNLVQFRALALHASDLSPIDNRPGTWIVRNPTGEILLEEKAPAKEWGVVSGSFPLASDADVGQWSVAWRSGNTEERASFTVEPFVLPRFRIESETDKSFYQSGDTPHLRGSVVYSSGAPVTGAKLQISWRATGAWPPPTDWISGETLPTHALTGSNGRFELELPSIPADLRGQSTLTAFIAATDPAGDRVTANASVLLSEDAILVSAVTEFNDALVENTNNRVYLRVTNPVGYPLGGAKINVKRAWSPGDEGIDAELDTDGVTRIQFDPGRPISLIVPPMPVRKALTTPPGESTLQRLQDMVSQNQAGLEDMVRVESWLSSLKVCSHWVTSGSDDATLAFRVAPNGTLSAFTTEGAPLDTCIANTIASNRLPPGNDRLYAATFRVQASQLPTLSAYATTSMRMPNSLQEQITRAATSARTCLPSSFEGALPWVLFWESSAGKSRLQYSWMKDAGGIKTMPSKIDQCILSKLSPLELPQKASTSAIGIIRYTISQSHSSDGPSAPQPTIMQGYELSVHAIMGPDDLGSTTLRMQPGIVPNLRLRANPVLANAGDLIDLAFFRGPNYTGQVPRIIYASHEGANTPIELAKKAKGATFTLPEDAKGWYEFSAEGATARVFVQETEPLALHLTPTQKRYQPGELAEIQIETTVAGKGSKAAVGLFGVDNSLSQIATLQGPSSLDTVRPTISMQRKAFGSLEAQALSMGRIRGSFAAEATILRVQSVPTPDSLDAVIYDSAQTEFSPITELTDNFYIVLAELYVQTRQWEKSATEGALITPKKMSELWTKALKACKNQGHPATDAYGRPLRLRYLPYDLLTYVDPANVISDATRLPEDVENWQQWVEQEQP